MPTEQSDAQLLRDIEEHMRKMWDARLLPAACWPADLAQRLTQAVRRAETTLDGFKTADGITVSPGDLVWVNGSFGIQATKVDKAVTTYLLFGSPVPVVQCYSSESAAREALAR